MASNEIEDLLEEVVSRVVGMVDREWEINSDNVPEDDQADFAETSTSMQMESTETSISTHVESTNSLQCEIPNKTSVRDQFTQTTCTCQCSCSARGTLSDLDDSGIGKSLVVHDNNILPTPTPNKRKRGRPRKHPVIEPRNSSVSTENNAKPKTVKKRRSNKNASFFEPEEDDREGKVTTVNYNTKLKLPTLKIQLKRVSVKQEKPKKSHAEFKSEMLKNLKFVEVSNAFGKTDVPVKETETHEEDQEVDEPMHSDESPRALSTSSATGRLVYEETHGCDVCGKRFKEMINLKEHMKKQHGDDDETDIEDADEVLRDVNYVAEIPEMSDADADGVNDSDPEYEPKVPKAKNSRKRGKGKSKGDSPTDGNLDLAKLLGDGSNLMEVPQEVTQKGEKLLTCVICNKVFKGESHFLRHLGTHTGHRPFVCYTCGEGFNHRRNLMRHQSTHSKERPYSCDICHKRLKTASGLKLHLSQHENFGEKQYECEACGKKFSQKVGLDIHTATIHEGKRPYKCEYCEMAFGRVSHLIRHTYKHKIEMEGVELPFECLKCGKRYAREEQLKIHDRTHTGERPYPCLMCDKSFKSSGDLSAHMRVHTNIRQHVCHICGAAFKMKRGLNRHMSNHSEDRPHICEFCGLSFKHDQTLRIHLRTHTGYKPYKCSKCDYSCGQLGNLKSHMAKHSDERTCTCEICGKQFKHQRHMRRHMITHSEEKKYKCEVCGKAFSRLGSRKKHMYIHSGQKPYPCKVCGKTFRQSSTLRVHMMIHNNDRPYSCDICNTTFRRFAHLQRHKRTHTGEKPYACHICGKRFTRPVCLPNHMKRHERQGECPINGGQPHPDPLPMQSEGNQEEYVGNHDNIHQVVDPQVVPPSNPPGATALHPFLFTMPYYAAQSAWPCE